MRATVVTNHGTFVIALFDDVPGAAGAFAGLANGTREYGDDGAPHRGHFYDHLLFHRVVPGALIQGGCPYGLGTGGPGWRLPREASAHRHDRVGVVGLVHMGNDSFGSQFYITTAPAPELDGEHLPIGQVVDGLDVLTRVAAQPVDDRERPVWPVVIDTIRVV